MPQSTDPYQWFFPPGILLGFIGTGIWITFGFKFTTAYPNIIHTEMMILGFYLAMASGFLMTAIPRFSGTNSATFLEKLTILIPILALLVTGFCEDRFWFHGLACLIFFLLLRFKIARFRKAALTPVPPIILVGFGLLFGLSGSMILLINDFFSLSSDLVFFARSLVFYGLFYGLVLGIGTQLVPAIMGLKRGSEVGRQPTPLSTSKPGKKRLIPYIILGIILTASFVLETWVSVTVGRGLQAVLLSGMILFLWRIYLLPKAPGRLTLCLWVSAWMLVIGAWVRALFPTYAVHGAHLLFIGSLSLMVFSIATRVTLSHGGHDLKTEVNSKGLLGMLLLFLAATVSRLVAPYAEDYFRHLAYASIFWWAAATLWITTFLPKILKRNL